MNWSRLECEAIVADYFDMLAMEIAGTPFVKAKHRRALLQNLGGRSERSVEFKHMNISAVLVHAGERYITGYKPAWNYQGLLKDVVLDVLAARGKKLEVLEIEELDALDSVPVLGDPSKLFVLPPDRRDQLSVGNSPVRTPRKVNFAEREERNRHLGELGEEYVVQVEKQRLELMGRSDLAKEIEWTSRDRGDGAGYDIRSFDGETDDELFVEVKTTNSGKYQPFFISANEVDFSKEHSDRFSLYRVFGFDREPKIFRLPGAIDQHLDLEPQLFRAGF